MNLKKTRCEVDGTNPASSRNPRFVNVAQPVAHLEGRKGNIFLTRTIVRKEPGQLSGIALGYGLEDRGVRVPARAKGFFSPLRTDQLWVPPSLLSNG
jgi:hypothetical protein